MSVEAPAPISTPRTSFQSWTIRGLALIGVLACLALIAIVVLISAEFGRRVPPAQVEASDPKQLFMLGETAQIPGRPLLRMDVLASDGRGNPYSSYGGSGNDQRNVVLLDTRTGKSRRILPDNDRHISFDLLGGDEKGISPTFYYAQVAQSGDSGLQDVLVGDLVSGRQAWVIKSVDGVDWVSMPDATHVALVLRERRKLFYRTIDMTRFALTTSFPIAIDR